MGVKKRATFRAFFTGFLGIFIFLIAIGILNLISQETAFSELKVVTSFINYYFLFLLLTLVILFLGDLFSTFPFPFNIFYPIINSFGSIFVIQFFFGIFFLLDQLTSENISNLFSPFFPVITILVPIVVLVIGYTKVASEFSISNKEEKRKLRESIKDFKESSKNLIKTLKESFSSKNKVVNKSHKKKKKEHIKSKIKKKRSK